MTYSKIQKRRLAMIKEISDYKKAAGIPNKKATWYSIKREIWSRFIAYLKTIQKPVEELTEEERNLWDCYYIAKEHGRNEKGLFELPYKRWEIVNKCSKIS